MKPVITSHKNGYLIFIYSGISTWEIDSQTVLVRWERTLPAGWSKPGCIIAGTSPFAKITPACLGHMPHATWLLSTTRSWRYLPILDCKMLPRHAVTLTPIQKKPLLCFFPLIRDFEKAISSLGKSLIKERLWCTVILYRTEKVMTRSHLKNR